MKYVKELIQAIILIHTVGLTLGGLSIAMNKGNILITIGFMVLNVFFIRKGFEWFEKFIKEDKTRTKEPIDQRN